MNYTPLPDTLKRRSNKKRIILLLLFLLTASLLSIRLTKHYLTRTSVDAVHIVEKIAEGVFEPKESQPLQLKSNIDQALKDSTATYAVVVKNLKTNESYYLNEDKKFMTASLYKLWVMATTYEKIYNGELNEEDILQGEISQLNDKFNIASEEAELQEGKVEMSIGTALDKMITISDNYSALLLTEKIGIKSIKNFLMTQGLVGSELSEPPKSTASDMAAFFEKLYYGELADEVYTAKMISLLTKQQLNQVLPKYLPKEVVVAHKTGSLYTFSHDAGVVYTEKGDYIIVLLSNSNNTIGANERMARISEAVYSYFQNRVL